MAKIDKLTPEQEAKIPAYLKKWIDNGTNTALLDQDKAVEAVNWIYEFCGFQKPKMVFVDGPFDFYEKYAAIEKPGKFKREPGQPLTRDYISKVKKDVGYQTFYEGNLWVGWVGFYDFVLNEVFPKKKSEFESFMKYCEHLQNIHIFWAYDEYCFVCQRPEAVHFSEERLHNESGPAILYRDGFTVYALNGVRVPDWLVETPASGLDPKRVLGLQNAEQRLAGIRKVGIDRFLDHLNAEKIHEWNEYQFYYLTIEGTKVGPYLRMVNPSTGQIHFEGVGDAEKYESIDPTIKTCQDALAWRNQLEKFTAPEQLT